MGRDFIFSIITIVFSSIFLYFSLQLPAAKKQGEIGAGGWPTFLLVCMLILGIASLIRTLIERKKIVRSAEEIANEDASEAGELVAAPNQEKIPKRHWFVVIFMALYLFIIPLTGFLVGTFLFVLLITWLFGMKKPIHIFLSGAISSVALTYFFITLLRLPLPRGVSIFHKLSLFF